MATASGLDKFRVMDDIAKLDLDLTQSRAKSAENTENNTPNPGVNLSPEGQNAPDPTAVNFAAAAAASRLLSLQRDLGNPLGSPLDFIKQLDASNRGRGGFDRLMSLAGFGFPGFAGLPPLNPLSPPNPSGPAGHENELVKGGHSEEGSEIGASGGGILSARLTPSENLPGKSIAFFLRFAF